MSGPVTKDTSSIAFGMAQIRVGASAANIGKIHAALVAADSIGSLANTKFTAEVEFWKHSSGFPLLEDLAIPLRANAKLECAMEEISPENLALATGVDISSGSYLAHSGEVALGALESPAYIRMEGIYTFPETDYEMHIIFPRAQIEGSTEIDLQKEDAAATPITFASKRADSSVSGGNAVWDAKPLGRITFVDNS